MAQRVMRIGLYGCNMYRTRDLVAGAAAACPGRFRIEACYDIVRAKADAAAALYGGTAYAEEEPFLAHETDVVVISLPPHLHPGAFARTAAAGRDVYLEKPVCVNDEGRALLLETARARRVRCYVGLSYRHIHPFLTVAEILRRPDAGRLLSLSDHWLSPGGAVPETPPEARNWRHRMDQGGGQLVNHCCHFIDWCRWVGGEMASVTAVEYSPGDPSGPHEEIELSASFVFRAGGLASFRLSQHSHQSFQYGTALTENLGIRWHWSPHSRVEVYRTRPRAADETVEWDSADGPEGGLSRDARQMKEFMEAWFADAAMPITLRDGIAAYDLACAVRESCRTGRRVAAPPLVDLPA